MKCRTYFSLWFSVALSSCASVPAIPRSPGERITIEYHQGPFCGACDSLKIVVTSNGKAIWEHGYWLGKYTDWEVERQPMRLDPQQFQNLRELLAPYRPTGEKWLRVGGNRSGETVCAEEYSDLPERRIKWETDKKTDELWLGLGCDPQANARLFELVNSIPSRLGIKAGFDLNTWVASTKMS